MGACWRLAADHGSYQTSTYFPCVTPQALALSCDPYGVYLSPPSPFLPPTPYTPPPPQDSEPITALALSPDKHSLVAASRSLSVRLWDWTNGECKRTWKVSSSTWQCSPAAAAAAAAAAAEFIRRRSRNSNSVWWFMHLTWRYSPNPGVWD